MSGTMLPEELLWAAGGHASDVVLTALADGELGIVPVNVRAHVEACPTCTQHLGHAALLSIHAARELESIGRPARRPLPRLAIALALVVAALGIAADAPAIRIALEHDVPLALRALGTLGERLLDPGSATGMTLTYGTSALLVAMALVLVRWLPKKELR
jgi:hypothetical protein